MRNVNSCAPTVVHSYTKPCRPICLLGRDGPRRSKRQCGRKAMVTATTVTDISQCDSWMGYGPTVVTLISVLLVIRRNGPMQNPPLHSRSFPLHHSEQSLLSASGAANWRDASSNGSTPGISSAADAIVGTYLVNFCSQFDPVVCGCDDA